MESSKLERRTAISFRNGLSCELSYLMEFKNNTYQRMQRSVLVGAGDAPTWRHHDVAQLLIWLSYITAAGLAHRAPSPSLFGQSVEDVPMDRYRGIGGGWGADLAMAMWVPLVGRLPLLFRNWALRRPSHGLASNFHRTMV